MSVLRDAVHRLVTRLAPIRTRIFQPSAGIVVSAWLIALAGAAGDDGTPANAETPTDHHWVACNAGIDLPRTVRMGNGVDRTLVRNAMAEWNTRFGEVFIDLPEDAARPADVEVVADSSTWVELPCQTVHSVIHAGGETNLGYWLTHEFGHTLGLADHIRVFDDASRYINPGHCPQDGYDGVMSYCTPRERWFGAEDVAMMRTLFPDLALQSGSGGVRAASHTPRLTLPDVARDR